MLLLEEHLLQLVEVEEGVLELKMLLVGQKRGPELSGTLLEPWMYAPPHRKPPYLSWRRRRVAGVAEEEVEEEPKKREEKESLLLKVRPPQATQLAWHQGLVYCLASSQ